MRTTLRGSVRRLLPAVIVLAGFATSFSTETTVPPPGIRENTPAIHALTNIRIVVAPGNVIERGTIVVRDGAIVAAGATVAIPADARVWDMEGKTAYPGLIEAYSEMSAGKSRGASGGDDRGSNSPGTPESKGGANYWNEHVTPQKSVASLYVPDTDENLKLRSQGITARLVAPGSGIIKGTSVLVNTGNGDRSIVKEDVALHGSLTTRGGFGSNAGYPDSPMGAMTLFRQAFYDAGWYSDAWAAYNKAKTLPHPEKNDALAALQGYAGGTRPVIIDASNELFVLRADQVGREFGLNTIVHGSGNEYRRLDAIVATGRAVIVPLNFPEAPNVKTPEDAMAVTLEDLMHWDIAPENAGRLDHAGVKIALTTDGLKDKGGFLKAVRTAVSRGLSADAALRALTVTPATLFGAADRLGTIESGKDANFVITDGDLFEKKTKVLETWVDGERYEVESTPLVDARGTWTVSLSEKQTSTDTITLSLKGEPAKLSGSVSKNSQEEKLSEAGLSDVRLGISFKGDSLGWDGVIRMSATVVGDTLLGAGVWADGSGFKWSAARTTAFAEEPDTSEADEPKMSLYPVNYPLGDFGVSGPPARPDAVLFKNGTVWTSGPKGKIEGGSVLVRKGKIAAVGTDLKAPSGAVVVDLAGKHITPGVIDCHSHIATDGGINESGQTITAEVRISDFIDPDDIAIYRQLAGGVTSAHILHGSANVIGGQDQVIKLRWGVLPEELKFANAPPGIKWALGENVKQSNWGEQFSTRYPQTRMGVEQILRDEYKAAQDYKARWSAWNKTKRGIPPRRDLELDAMVEVLDGKRLVHCHAYRQDEMLATMRVCEEFGVTIATFDHALEGYKVAAEMAKHGVAGTAFSDWWAYKFEVYDAIPYNGALMHNAGVSVSFNSDSDELGRRLNWEAGKAVKYGGVSEEEALKFVTYNPAEQLGVEDRVGSIETGKDADLTVWNGPPLSAFAMCEQTWVDGQKYFDREDDLMRRAEDASMRTALIQKILKSGDAGGGKAGKRGSKWPRYDVFGTRSHFEEEGR
jgi:N-acetylglucosamine-6-phosphate deacetylase